MQLQQTNPEINPGTLLEVANDAVTRTFEVTPDTIYGLLLGILLIFLALVFWLRERENRKQTERMYQLQGHTVKAMEASNTALMLVQQGLATSDTKVVKEIEDARDIILREVGEIKTALQN